VKLLPGWPERLAEAPTADGAAPPPTPIPLSPAFYAGRVTAVADAAGATAMRQLALERPVAWAGFDTEYRYDRPGVPVGRGRQKYDPRDVRPLLLSLALAERDGAGAFRLSAFVADLRSPDVLPALRDVLRLPVPFASHFAQAELFCLWQLGLPEPDTLWDTWAHERAGSLGRRHRRYRQPRGGDGAGQARARTEAEEDEAFGNSLVATCRRHGFEHPFSGDKDRLQESFLAHPDGSPFTPEQIQYAAADAVAAARLYPSQVMAAALAGALQHLTTVEMPWAVTAARMAWRGVRVDGDLCRRASEACDRHLEALRPDLAAHGITNVRSPAQLTAFFGRHGLLELFREGGGHSFDKKRLEAALGHHPAVPLIRAARRVLDLREEKVLTGEFAGADGRVHPDHGQLGTHSGRQTCRFPNLLGLGRLFRPLVVPDPGRGIGEADLCQVEVGVAAAVYGDGRLVEMFNTGDVYSAMAQHFYRDRLPAEDRGLGGDEFKRRHAGLRNRMKVCTLGIIYGLTPHGLAAYLDTPEAKAAELQGRFMAMFPALR
jgi:DNA polymerase-1